MLINPLGIYAERAAYRTAVEAEIDAYRAEMANRRAYYDGDRAAYASHLADYLRAHYEVQQTRQRMFALWPHMPVVRHAVDTQAAVYVDPPQRVLYAPDGQPLADGPEAQYFGQWQRDCSLNDLWMRASRRAVLCNSTLVWVQWYARESRVWPRVVSPEVVWVDPDDAAPNDVQAMRGIAVEVGTTVVPWRVTEQAERRFWRYIRADDGMIDVTVTDVHGHIVGDPLPWRLTDYPFVKVDEWTSDAEFYLSGGDDILAEPLAAGKGLAELRHAMHFSAYPQLTVTGLPLNTAIPMGPGTVMTIEDPAARAEFLSPSFNFAAQQQLIWDQLTMWAALRNLPADALRPDRAVESGIARYVARLGLYEQRKLRIPAYETAEAELWRLSCMMRAAALAIGDYSRAVPAARIVPAPRLADTRMQAIFPRPMPLLSPLEEHQLWQARTRDGLENPAQRLADEQRIALADAERLQAEWKTASAPMGEQSPTDAAIRAGMAALAGGEEEER